MKAIVLVGISASGKSTYAAEMVKQGYHEINRDFIRFNIVKPGADWRTYKFTNAQEKEVTEIHGKMIMESAERGEDIIVSDTNLHAGRRTTLCKQLEDLGYTVTLVPLAITLEEAWKRDAYRLNGVGHNVLYNQWKQWNEFTGRRTYTPDTSKPKVIIVDVDGTVAEMNGRGPFEWHRVGEDLPRKFVIQMVQSYYELGYEIIICSGRSDECSQQTTEWLDKHLGAGVWGELYMRKEGDFRKDNAVKEEIFWTNIADRYNVVACIDDRPQMIRLWHDLRIPNVIAVANPYVEF